MRVIIVALLLTGSGCCTLRHPLDGKAQSWCAAEKKGAELCANHGGLTKGYWNPSYINCQDGTRFERQASGEYDLQEDGK